MKQNPDVRFALNTTYRYCADSLDDDVKSYIPGAAVMWSHFPIEQLFKYVRNMLPAPDLLSLSLQSL